MVILQSRRAFFKELATFIASGIFVTAGKEQINSQPKKKDLQEQKPENSVRESRKTNNFSLPTITTNHVADFTLGGTLGIAGKKAIAESIRLNRLNKELTSAESALQQLKKDTLPYIKQTLEEFVKKEGINYKSNDSNTAQSILGLIDAISIHVSTLNKTTKPFLEELQKLRIALSGLFTEKLQQDSDIKAATKEAMLQVLRSEKLIAYLETTVIDELKSSNKGEVIGKNTVDCLTKGDLVNDDGFIAFQQTVAETFKSKPVLEALISAISTEITEYDTAARIIKTLLRRLRITLQGSDLDVTTLKEALTKTLKDEGVSKKLNAAICNSITNPEIAKELVKVLQRLYLST